MTPVIISMLGLALSLVLIYPGLILPSFDHNAITATDEYMRRQVQAATDSLRLQSLSAGQFADALKNDSRLNDVNGINIIQEKIFVEQQGQYFLVSIPYGYNNLFNLRFDPSRFPPFSKNVPRGKIAKVTIDRV